MDATGSTRTPTGARAWTFALGACGGVMLLAAVASIGSPAGAAGALGAVIFKAGSAWPAVLYLLGAHGLGRLVSRVWRGAALAVPLQFGAGLALMLTASHLLGVAGLLNGRAGLPIGLGVCVVGAALACEQWARAAREGKQATGRTRGGAWLAAAPAGAVLLVASCMPPGWLWDSEFGGYDVLSYHLQLPQEWLALGVLRPLEHNVYSFLPGYVEAAYLHLAAMTGAPRPVADGTPSGLLAADGWRALSCQMLHAGLAVCAAWLVARATLAAADRWMPANNGTDLPRTAGTACAGLAGAIVLATPWTVVSGSLAYNEMGVVALTAAAMIAAVDRGLGAPRRWLLAGALVGAACGVKPTALLFTTPVVGLMLITTTPRSEWLRAASLGAVAGVAMLIPWLARNAMHGGNPVFPFLASVFGSAHWTDEQTTRYAAAHAFDGSLADRLRLLVLRDESDPAGPRHRGMMHAQWGVFFPLLAAAGAAALLGRARIGAIILGVGLMAQLLAWMFATHLQSRFLMPMLAPGTVLIGLGLCGLADRGTGVRRAAVVVGAIGALVQSGLTLGIYAGQRSSSPSLLLPVGTDFHAVPSTSPDEADAGSLGFLNRRAPAGRTVYLLGEATPFYFTGRVVYNTTWDRWPLGEAIDAAPDNPAAWSASLRKRGIDAVLVCYPELERLRRSGYADPRVTPERVARWLESAAVPIRAWPGEGRALYALPEGAP